MRASLLAAAVGLALFVHDARAAVREPRSAERAPVRVLADIRAQEPMPAQAAAAAPAPAPSVPSPSFEQQSEHLRREIFVQLNSMSARFDELDARIYEIVGRLQLLAVCLIAFFVGVLVWQMALTRQVARLEAARRASESGGLG